MRLSSVVVCIPARDELTRRGELVLRRSLESLRRSRDFLQAKRSDVAVRVAVCDDGSTDATPAFFKAFFSGWPEFDIVVHSSPQGAGAARNSAAARFPGDVVAFLDADDQFHDRHLYVGLQALEERRGQDGRPLAAVSTAAAVSEAVHPDWEARISRTIPITKFVRREAWEFVEGMPSSAVYRIVTCEDQFLVRKLGEFFELLFVPERTATYWNYPGSALARQLAKFQRPPGDYDPSRDDPPEWQELGRLMARYEAAFLQYLRGKWNEPHFHAVDLPFARRPTTVRPVPGPTVRAEVRR